MSRQTIYIPANSPEDWQRFLAEPNLQWKMGYSARTLAMTWHDAQGEFPDEIDRIFKRSPFGQFKPLAPLMILPEYKVPIMGRGKDSQNDLFVLAKAGDGELVSMTVEGKVEESFGSTIKKWLQSSKGDRTNKERRLYALEDELGLEAIPDTIYYQLLHRCASAIIEARRFNAAYAVCWCIRSVLKVLGLMSTRSLSHFMVNRRSKTNSFTWPHWEMSNFFRDGSPVIRRF